MITSRLMNQHLLILVALALGFLVLVATLAGLLGRRPSGYPYESYDSLLSAAERSFFGVLQQALVHTAGQSAPS
jgi:hypothetical protein